MDLTPLCFAADSNASPEFVKVLLESGADPNAVDEVRMQCNLRYQNHIETNKVASAWIKHFGMGSKAKR
jgi:ankyrin repeat protein